MLCCDKPTIIFGSLLLAFCLWYMLSKGLRAEIDGVSKLIRDAEDEIGHDVRREYEDHVAGTFVDEIAKDIDYAAETVGKVGAKTITWAADEIREIPHRLEEMYDPEDSICHSAPTPPAERPHMYKRAFHGMSAMDRMGTWELSSQQQLDLGQQEKYAAF